MQNFLAIVLFAVLVATVFWPDEVFRNHQAGRSAVHTNVEERGAETKKGEVPTITGAGMLYHYIGIEERRSKND